MVGQDLSRLSICRDSLYSPAQNRNMCTSKGFRDTMVMRSCRSKIFHRHDRVKPGENLPISIA